MVPRPVTAAAGNAPAVNNHNIHTDTSSSTIENTKILPVSETPNNSNTAKVNGTNKQSNDVNKENIPNTNTTNIKYFESNNNSNSNNNSDSTNRFHKSAITAPNIELTAANSNGNALSTSQTGTTQANNNNNAPVVAKKSPNLNDNTSSSNINNELVIDPSTITLQPASEISTANSSSSTSASVTPTNLSTTNSYRLTNENGANDASKPADSAANANTTTSTSLPSSNQTANANNTITLSAAAPAQQTNGTAQSAIPTPIQSTSRIPSAAASKQRAVTSIGGGILGSNTVKLKKSDTVRNPEFPKSASTDKSKIESFLSRNVPNSSLINPESSVTQSHSYRSKAEMLHQQNSHLPLSQQQSAAAAATVGTASLLTSSISANTNGNHSIKSQSAAPIKLDSSMSSGAQKSELRPRLVFSFV